MDTLAKTNKYALEGTGNSGAGGVYDQRMISNASDLKTHMAE